MSNILIMTLSKFNLTWTMQFQPILSKIVNASVSKLYELSVQMSLSNGAVIPSYVIPEAQTEARAENVISLILPTVWPQKSI